MNRAIYDQRTAPGATTNQEPPDYGLTNCAALEKASVAVLRQGIAAAK